MKTLLAPKPETRDALECGARNKELLEELSRYLDSVHKHDRLEKPKWAKVWRKAAKEPTP